MMRKPKRAATPSPTGAATPPVNPDATGCTSAGSVRSASIPPAPPQPNAATRQLKRMPLRRMPTELILTTRMLPVRHEAEFGSSIRPVREVAPTNATDHALENAIEVASQVVDERRPAPAPELATPFDRRPTAPCLPRFEQAIAAAMSSRREDYPCAQVLMQPVQPIMSEAQWLAAGQVVAPPRPRPAPNVATQHADYAAMPMRHDLSDDAYAHIPELGSDNVVEVTPTQLPTHAYASPRHTPAAPAYAAPRPAARPQPSAASARPQPPAPARPDHPDHPDHHAQHARKRAATPSDSRRPLPSDEQQLAHDALTQAHRQLALAMETARKSEQRARDAERMAAWAERYVPQRHASEQQYIHAGGDSRLRWLKRAFQVSLVGLAVGGYVSLLGPVRERVISQNATIQRLTDLQEELRSEQRELRERMERERSAAEEKALSMTKEPRDQHDQRDPRDQREPRAAGRR